MKNLLLLLTLIFSASTFANVKMIKAYVDSVNTVDQELTVMYYHKKKKKFLKVESPSAIEHIARYITGNPNLVLENSPFFFEFKKGSTDSYEVLLEGKISANKMSGAFIHSITHRRKRTQAEITEYKSLSKSGFVAKYEDSGNRVYNELLPRRKSQRPLIVSLTIVKSSDVPSNIECTINGPLLGRIENIQDEYNLEIDIEHPRDILDMHLWIEEGMQDKEMPEFLTQIINSQMNGNTADLSLVQIQTAQRNLSIREIKDGAYNQESFEDLNFIGCKDQLKL